MINPMIYIYIYTKIESSKQLRLIRKLDIVTDSHVQNENFILDFTRIFMKTFHFFFFHGSFIFPKYILIFSLILINSTSN